MKSYSSSLNKALYGDNEDNISMKGNLQQLFTNPLVFLFFLLWSMLIIGCIDASIINDANSIPQSKRNG